jgi:hypothetical protein
MLVYFAQAGKNGLTIHHAGLHQLSDNLQT